MAAALARPCRPNVSRQSRTFRTEVSNTATAGAPAPAALPSTGSRGQQRRQQRRQPSQVAEQRQCGTGSRQQRQLPQQLAQLGSQQLETPWQLLQSCLPAGAAATAPTSYAASAAVAAALGLGGLLATAGPAGASELLNTVQSGAFIPGLVGDDPVREGFIQALLLIFFSEIGDKTFFIALLLALQQPRSLVFAGTFGALAIMTVISVGLGRFLHIIDEVVPTAGLPLDDLLAVALLTFFGIQTLRNAATADATAAEEKEEAQEVVSGFGSGAAALTMVASTFTLVFAAEWGDKSFLATIALAAASSPTGVVLGAIAGHGIATVIAVLGGSFLGKYLDEKVVQYVGGSLFLVFAAASIYDLAVGAH